MLWFILIIVIILVACIVFLTWHPKGRVQTREQFLEKMARYLEGEIEAIEGYENSARIKFAYEGVPFVYEEIEVLSFRTKAFKATLIATAPSDLTLYFKERKATRIIRHGYDEAPYIKDKPLGLPQSLHVYNAYANNPEKAYKFLEDSKALNILNYFKDVGSKGYPYMPLKIVNGEISLEFNAFGHVRPELTELRKHVPSIENYLEKLATIVNVLKRIEQEKDKKEKKGIEKMNRIKSFVATTLLGGVIVILPVAIFVLVLSWLFNLITSLIQPITNLITARSDIKEIIADAIVILIILTVCFLVGVFVRTRFGRFIYGTIETHLLKGIPGYKMIKETVLQFAGNKKSPFSSVALSQIYENQTLVTSFVTDEHPDGSYSVFVPTAPNPTSGFVYHLEREYVHPIDVSIEDAMRSVLSCGAGSSQLVEIYKGKLKTTK